MADQQDIIASIRLGLDQLDKDMNTAQAKITKLDKNITNEGAKTGKGFSTGLKKGFQEAGKQAENFGKNITKAFGPIGIAIALVTAAFAAFKKGMDEAAARSTAHKKAVDDVAGATNKLAQANGNASSSMGETSTKMSGLGVVAAEVGKIFDKFVSTIASAKGVIDKFIGDVIDKFNPGMREAAQEAANTEKALQAQAVSANELSKALDNHNSTLKKQIELEKLLGSGEDLNTRLSLENSLLETLVSQKIALEEQGNYNGAMAKEMDELIAKTAQNTKNYEAQAKLKEKEAKDAKVTLGEAEKRKQIEADINKQINEINKSAENEAAHLKANGATQEELLKLESERDKQLKSIYQTGVSQLDLLSAEYNVNKELSPRLFAQREAWAQSRDAIKESVDYTQAQLDMMNKISDALAEQAVATAQEKGDIIQQVELQKQLIDAQRQRAMEALQQTDEFKALLPETQTEVLANFQAVTDGMKNQAEAAIREAGKTRKELLTNQADALAQITVAEAAKNAALTGDIQTQIDLENELMREQRARARELLVQSAEYQTASDEDRKVLTDNFDAITKSMEKTVTTADKFNAAMGSTIGKAAQSVASGTMDMVSNIGGMMVEQLQHDTEEAIAKIDEQLAIKKAEIEEARNQALMEAGFIEAQTSEDMQAKIDAAKEAGDEVLQYELERRQEEMRINEEYDAKAKEAEEKAAREKLDLQYKADMAAYKQKIADTTLTIAQSIASAVSAGMQFGPAAVAMVPVLTAMAAAMGGAQMAVLLANPPKKPAFADGGIVPGNPRLGDVQQILATGGEGVFTADQMEAMGMMANNGGGGGGQEVVQYLNVYIDGELVGKSVARFFNAKGAIIEQRALIGN
ncbi:hypothetical protein AGMMS50267_15670 [Spirochaetia bacterium]|nr:hypothetical protein AGMMS50267_15670 [Spirochaetia bacterium]